MIREIITDHIDIHVTDDTTAGGVDSTTQSNNCKNTKN